MTVVTVLPPQPNPKQLTAFHRAQKLEEHLIAFLATNNPSGFKLDDEIAVSELDRKTIGHVLLHTSQQDHLSRWETTGLARELGSLMGKGWKHERTLNAIAVLMGYRDWNVAAARFKLVPGGDPDNKRDWLLPNLRKQRGYDMRVVTQANK